MIKAYVLVTHRRGSFYSFAEQLAKQNGILSVEALAGNYDAIVTIEAPDLREVGEIVMGVITNLPETIKTTTLFVIGEADIPSAPIETTAKEG